MAMDLRPDDEDGSYDTARAILELIEGLDGYPIVCEQAHSDLEMERMERNIDEWLLSDLWREITGGTYKERGSYVAGKFVQSNAWCEGLPENFEELADELIESEPDWLVEFAREVLWSMFGYYSVDDMPVDEKCVHVVRAAIAKAIELGEQPGIRKPYEYGLDFSDLEKVEFYGPDE